MKDPVILSAEQRELLVAVLNRVIPSDQTFPGAGDLGGVVPIERMLSDEPLARRVFLDGLAAIEIAAWRHGDTGFVALTADHQDDVLRDVERAAPAFFDQLVSQTYRHYYVNAKVVQLLGLSAEPPQPAGHYLPPFDPALLDRVRARGPIYRLVPRS